MSPAANIQVQLLRKEEMKWFVAYAWDQRPKGHQARTDNLISLFAHVSAPDPWEWYISHVSENGWIQRDLYTCAVDIWSYGCIFIECCIGKPLFLASDNVNLLVLHMKLIGELTVSDVKSMKSNEDFSFSGMKRETTGWSKLFSARTFGCVYEELCKQILKFDVDQRFTASDIIESSYFC